MSAAFAPLALLWPGGLLLAFADGRRRWAGWCAVAVLAAALVALVALTLRVLDEGAVSLVAGGWPADVGIRLRVDALGAVFALLSCGVLLAALVHGVLSGVDQRLFPALTLFLALGLTGLFVTGDVFSFYVFFELAISRPTRWPPPAERRDSSAPRSSSRSSTWSAPSSSSSPSPPSTGSRAPWRWSRSPVERVPSSRTRRCSSR